MSVRTVRLHRVLRAKPEKVYRAFLEPDAMSKWIPPYEFTCKVHHVEVRMGGTFKMSFHCQAIMMLWFLLPNLIRSFEGKDI
jgi:uncharacterized protein YndB with AHSA1/START domain